MVTYNDLRNSVVRRTMGRHHKVYLIEKSMTTPPHQKPLMVITIMFSLENNVSPSISQGRN